MFEISDMKRLSIAFEKSRVVSRYIAMLETPKTDDISKEIRVKINKHLRACRVQMRELNKYLTAKKKGKLSSGDQYSVKKENSKNY